MRSFIKFSLLLLTLALVPIKAMADTTYNCAADKDWFANPSMPLKVKKSGADGSSNFCDFYQFSWQAFAYLMAPSKADSSIRNFEDQAQYPELQVDSKGNPANSCDKTSNGNSLFVRHLKPGTSEGGFMIPERIGQAGGGATIYDQQKNVVYYDVKFDRGTCDVAGIKEMQNFPAGTTELKTAWKVIDGNDNPADFITMKTMIGSDTTSTTLAMVGFHIAIATKDHPEFVWSTFEHNVNVPDCKATPADENTAWSFTSPACTTALAQGDQNKIKSCDFNNPTAETARTGPASEICRDFPYGSDPTDPNYAENVGDIVSLNKNVQPYLTGDAFGVLTNYFNLGALWVSDPMQSSTLSNQRGSLRLANAVAETDYMDVSLKSSFVSNCFGCHNYAGKNDPSKGKNTTSGSLSHIFDDIAVGVGQCLDVQSSTVINSQQDAKTQCPKTCNSGLAWNGQWTNQSAKTGAQLPMSVCGCCGSN